MSGEQTPNKDIEGIIGGAAAQEGNATQTISQDDLKAMADALELLTADFGTWKGYKAASTEYIKEFTKEIVWHRRIRAAVAVACGILIVFFAIVLVCGLNNSDTLFTAEQSHALTALIVGCITGCVIVTIALVKGAFSNLTDRNAGLPMPDHIKEIVDAAKNIVGGPGNN